MPRHRLAGRSRRCRPSPGAARPRRPAAIGGFSPGSAAFRRIRREAGHRPRSSGPSVSEWPGPSGRCPIPMVPSSAPTGRATAGCKAARGDMRLEVLRQVGPVGTESRASSGSPSRQNRRGRDHQAKDTGQPRISRTTMAPAVNSHLLIMHGKTAESSAKAQRSFGKAQWGFALAQQVRGPSERKASRGSHRQTATSGA